jgi:HK97 family phage portal protein
MALLSRLLLGGSERPTSPSGPLPVPVEPWLLGRTDAGREVTEYTALQVAAVWRAVALISGTSSSLPLKTYRDGTRERVASVVDDPNPDLTPFEVLETLWFSLLLWGNSYQQKIRNQAGDIVELWPLPASQMQVGRGSPSDDFPGGKVFKLIDGNGETHVMSSRDVFHVPGPGYDGVCGVSPIRMASQGIGMALAAEEYGARLFGSGSMMAGILQTEQRLDNEQADRIKERWRTSVTGLRRSHEIAVIGSGAKFQPVTMPNRDAQFLESRKFQVTEIARWFGIPPHLLFDVDGSTSWGTGIEHQSIGMVVYTLRPWLTRVEQRITKELLPPGTYAEFNVEGLLRGDSAARAAFYRTMVEIRAMNPNEVRARENLEPYDGGEVFENPNITTSGSDADEVNVREVAEILQKLYLSVGTVITVDEARRLIAKTGIDLDTASTQELSAAQVRALMGRLSRPDRLDDIDPAALVSGMDDAAPLVLEALAQSIEAAEDVHGLRERVRALGPKENA